MFFLLIYPAFYIRVISWFGNRFPQVLMGAHFLWLISGKILISWNCMPTPLVPWVTVLSLVDIGVMANGHIAGVI